MDKPLEALQKDSGNKQTHDALWPVRSVQFQLAMGSSFGHLFRISTFGESHGGGVGVIVDGCPPRLAIDIEAVQAELDRRKPGQSKITTPRKEDDRVEALSGLLDGVSLGTPIAMVVRNKDQRPGDYKEMQVAFRPSHADATYQSTVSYTHLTLPTILLV